MPCHGIPCQPYTFEANAATWGNCNPQLGVNTSENSSLRTWFFLSHYKTKDSLSKSNKLFIKYPHQVSGIRSRFPVPGIEDPRKTIKSTISGFSGHQAAGSSISDLTNKAQTY